VIVVSDERGKGIGSSQLCKGSLIAVTVVSDERGKGIGSSQLYEDSLS
jgi:hypothetical protein